MKLRPLIKEIGFRDRASKSVDDVASDKFEDFGVTVGQLYQKFQNKDMSADPAIAQKIMNMVDTDDDDALMSQIKDLEFLVNQLPNKQKPTGKIGFRRGINESNMPINSPIDLIDNDILNIPDGDISGIKKAAAQLGIDPQNKYESELRDEIDNLLTSQMDSSEEYMLLKKYFGSYADELMRQYNFQIDEDDRSEKDKAFDLAQQLSKLTKDDKIKLKKIVQMMNKEKNEASTIQRSKVDYSTMDLKSNINEKWRTYDDMISDLEQWIEVSKDGMGDAQIRVMARELKELSMKYMGYKSDDFDKPAFSNEEKINGFDYHYTKGTSGGTQQFGRPRIVNE